MRRSSETPLRRWGGRMTLGSSSPVRLEPTLRLRDGISLGFSNRKKVLLTVASSFPIANIMTDKEFLATNDHHKWRKQKSRFVIEFLADALTCRQTPKSHKSISCAVYDAAKLFTLELEIEAEKCFPDLPNEIQQKIVEWPENARTYLDELVKKLTPQEACLN